MKKPKDSTYFLIDKRYRKNLKAWNRIRKAHKKSSNARKKERIKPYESIPLQLLYEQSPPLIKVKKKRELLIPSIFSIIENPKDSLGIIFELAAAIQTGAKEIVFNHSFMEEVDLAAESILDFAAMEMQREAKVHKRKYKFRGYYPRKKDLKEYIRATGIVKNLGIEHEFLTKEEEAKHRCFWMRSKKQVYVSPTVSDFKERVVKEFVDHIDNCLRDNNKQLNKGGRAKLALYTGEVIANAEDHSGFSEWTIVGHLDNTIETHMCDIAIFNFGKTIAETFSELPKDHYTIKEIEPYIEEHRKKSFFGSDWTENNLLTIVALQGHISSKNLTPEDDRGQGTVDLIDFFQKVHQDCVSNPNSTAKMAIVSGNTYILFDGKYKMAPDEKGRKIIAFNKDNDLKQKPDKNYIRNIGKLFFPGTIISIRFPMRDSQSVSVVKDEDV